MVEYIAPIFFDGFCRNSINRNVIVNFANQLCNWDKGIVCDV